MQFLEYFESEDDWENYEDRIRLRLISEKLKDDAISWFYTFNFMDYVQFREAFVYQYWDRETQLTFKRHIMSGKYKNSFNVSMAEYARKLIAPVKYFVPPMSDEEIIFCLSEHFDLETNLFLTHIPPSNLPELIKFLEKTDSVKRNMKDSERN